MIPERSRLHRSNWAATALALLVLCSCSCSLVACAAPDRAEQTSTTTSTTVVGAVPPEDTSRASAIEPAEHRTVNRWMKVLHPANMNSEDITRRPFVYWRAWINQKLPVGRVFWIMFISTTALQVLFKNFLRDATAIYRQRYLRSLGIGTLVYILAGMLVGALARSGSYQPLATVTLGMAQFLGFLGLTIVAQNIGDGLLKKVQPSKFLNPSWLGLLKLWLGVFLLSLLTLVPAIGAYRIGNRLLVLLASAGAGAAFSKWRHRERERDLVAADRTGSIQ